MNEIKQLYKIIAQSLLIESTGVVSDLSGSGVEQVSSEDGFCSGYEVDAAGKFVFQLLLTIVEIPANSSDAVISQQQIKFLSFADLHLFIITLDGW